MKHKNLRNSLAAAVFIVASGISIAVMAACSKPKALPDGTFSGRADGRNGAIEIAFSVKDGKITSTEILKEEETDFAKPAIKSILEKFTSTGKEAGTLRDITKDPGYISMKKILKKSYVY